jgi:cytoskeleton protein RodZ
VQQIGRVLREAREALGLSLEGCEEGTKIRRKYLEAMEDGRVYDLPGEVYLKGFLRSYGNFLGLDGAALVEQYKGSKYERRAAVEQPTGQAAPAQQREPAVVRSRPVRTPHRPGAFTIMFRRLVVAGLLAAVAGGLVWGGLQAGWRVGKTVDPAPAPEPIQTEQPPPQPQPEPKKEEPPPPPPPPEPAKVLMAAAAGDVIAWTVPFRQVEVKMEFDAIVWVHAEADNTTLFMGLAQPNTVREFKADRNLRVRVGYADAIRVTVNQQPFGSVAKSGPWTFVFTAAPPP